MSGYNKRRSGNKNLQFFPACFWHFRWMLPSEKNIRFFLRFLTLTLLLIMQRNLWKGENNATAECHWTNLIECTPCTKRHGCNWQHQTSNVLHTILSYFLKTKWSKFYFNELIIKNKKDKDKVRTFILVIE